MVRTFRARWRVPRLRYLVSVGLFLATAATWLAFAPETDRIADATTFAPDSWAVAFYLGSLACWLGWREVIPVRTAVAVTAGLFFGRAVALTLVTLQLWPLGAVTLGLKVLMYLFLAVRGWLVVQEVFPSAPRR